MYNGISNGDTMKHNLSTSGLTHTIEMDPIEALKIIAALTECVRLAVGPSKIPSHTEHDLEVSIPTTGQRLNGGLTIIIRP